MAAKETSQVEDNWQSEKSICESLKYSLDKHILCDVTFNVGLNRTRIQAHKLILSLRSSVFLVMMYGVMAKQDDIVIPDIEVAIFQEFLQFLYTDVVRVNGNNVVGLLYACRKYDVRALEKQCMEYLRTSMTSENACAVMEQAHLYDEPTLKEKAFKHICQNGDAALKSDTLVDLCRKCLDDVVKSDELKANEQTVFEAIVNWSVAACRNLGRKLTPENQRQVLGDIVLHVRYPLLLHNYFVNSVLTTKLLTESEGYKIMKHLLCPGENLSPFNGKQRNVSSSVETVCITRFDSLLPHTYSLSSEYYGITFSINKNAGFLGFQLYGAHDNTTQTYKVTSFLTNSSTDVIMEGLSLTTTVVADSKVFDVLLSQAVNLNKDVQYSLYVEIEGANSHYGLSGKSVVRHGTLTCSFFEGESSKHCRKQLGCWMRVNEGQVPALLFHV